MLIEWRREATKCVTVGYLVGEGGGGFQNDEKVCYVINVWSLSVVQGTFSESSYSSCKCYITGLILLQNCYNLWLFLRHHRKTIVEWIGSPGEELELTAELLKDDAKNYHAWQHRQWVMSFFRSVFLLPL